MYSDSIEDARTAHARGEYAAGVLSKQLNFQFYWRALKKHKWLILGFTGLMACLAVYYALVATPIYAAKSTLLLGSQKSSIISIEDLVSSDQDALDFYGTQIAVLRSRALAERVMLRLENTDNIPRSVISEMVSPSGFQPFGALGTKVRGVIGLEDAATDVEPTATVAATDMGSVLSGAVQGAGSKEFNETLKKFRDSLSINPIAKTSLVTILYESVNPEFSALVANAFADEYIESVLDRRQELKDEVSIWMDGRITDVASRLTDSEQALQTFKEANGLLDFNGGVGRLNEEELLRTSSELADARAKLASASEMYRTIQNYKASSPELLETLPAVQSDVLVLSVKTEYGRAQRDLSELRNR